MVARRVDASAPTDGDVVAIIRERWKTLWLHAHPIQAVAEALVPQALALVWSLVIHEVWAVVIRRRSRAGLWTNGHRRRSLHQWRRQLALGRLSDAAGGALVASPPDQPRRRVRAGHRADDHSLAAGTYAVSLGCRPHKSGRCPHEATAVDFLLSRYSLLWMLVLAGAFLFVRTGISLLVWWNRLRRRSLVWSLTNAHLLVVVIGSGALFGFIVLTEVYFTHSIEPQILPILVLMGILTVIAVLVVLPPSLLFSYIFARRTTRRLRKLTTATNALREGDYSVRVPVEGADEVAQLQANFNAMATDLSAAVRDLEAERDTVSHLLACAARVGGERLARATHAREHSARLSGVGARALGRERMRRLPRSATIWKSWSTRRGGCRH